MRIQFLQKIILIFAMMYQNKNSADSLANILITKFPKTKVINSEIYTGCVH